MKLPVPKITSRFSSLVSLSPLLCLAALLLYPWAFAAPSPDLRLLNQRHVQVREEINAIPEKLGRWIMYEDVKLPTGALEILTPNAHMSRIFQRIGKGKSVFATVMVIHCSDVRDMSNHYPPICYPRSGWTLLKDGTTDWTTSDGFGLQIMGRTYTFGRLEGNGLDRFITVADTFILPDGVTTRDMGDLLHVASQYRNSIEGVAQIQIYFEGDYRNEDSKEVLALMIDELIRGLPASLFEVLGGSMGTTDDRDSESAEQ